MFTFGRHISHIRHGRIVHGIGEAGRCDTESAVPISFDDVILSFNRTEGVIVFRTDAHFAARGNDRIGDGRFRSLIDRIRRTRPAGTGNGRIHRIRHQLAAGMIDCRRGKITGNIIISAHDDFRIGFYIIFRSGCDRTDTDDTAAVTIRFGDARHAASGRQRHRFRGHGFRGQFHRDLAVAVRICLIRAGRYHTGRLSVNISRIGRIVVCRKRQGTAFRGSDIPIHNLRLTYIVNHFRLRVDPLIRREGNIPHIDADLSVQIRISAIDCEFSHTGAQTRRFGIRFHLPECESIHFIGDKFRPVSDADFARAVHFRTGHDTAAADNADTHRTDFRRSFRRICRKNIDLTGFERIVFTDGNFIDTARMIFIPDNRGRSGRLCGNGRHGIDSRFDGALRCIARRNENIFIFRFFDRDCFFRRGKMIAIVPLRFPERGRDIFVICGRKFATVIDRNYIIRFVFDRGKKHSDADAADTCALDLIAHLHRFHGGNIHPRLRRGRRIVRFRFERGAGNIHRISTTPNEAGYRDIDGACTRGCLIHLLRDIPAVIRRNRKFLCRDVAVCDGNIIICLDIRNADSHIDADDTCAALRQIYAAVRRSLSGNSGRPRRGKRRTGQRRRNAGLSRIRIFAVPAGIVFQIRFMRSSRCARFLRIAGRGKFCRCFIGRGKTVFCFRTNFACAV